MRRYRTGPATWAALIALGAGMEAAALRGKRHEHTLSHALRAAFHTHTPAGKSLFVGSWVALSMWLLPHIVNPNTKDIL